MSGFEDSPHLEDASALAFYLSPTPRCMWSKRDFALSAWDGTTIAVIEDVQSLLLALADRGWPPFPLVNLLLLAMNGQGKDWLLFDKTCKAELAQFFGKQAGEAAAELVRIHHLARERFTSPQRRREVMAAVVRIALEAIGELSPSRARSCLKVWDEGLKLVPQLALQFTPAARIEGVRRFTQNFLAGLKEVHADSIDAQVLDEATLLEDPPPPVPLSLLAARLIHDLNEDEELGEAAEAARRLSGVLRLRRPFEHQEDVPTGGSSDLARKGDLQNLLLSEWAQDDLLFLARIAHQEALFRKPDSPPSVPAASRLMLVDSGLRSWGRMRLWLWGAALAAAAETPHALETRVLAVHSPRWNVVDFGSVEAFVKSVRTLSSELHPGACLPSILQHETAPPWDGDVVLVLAAETAADPDLARILAPLLARHRFHRIVVDREGNARWSEHHSGGWKPQGSCRLESPAPPKPPAKPARPKAKEVSGDLPAILRQSPFPLRIASSGAARRRLHHPIHGLVELTSDHRLIWWDRPGRGPIELPARLPTGKIAFAGAVGEHGEQALFAMKLPEEKAVRTYLVDFAAVDVRIDEHPVDFSSLACVYAYKSILYFVSPQKIRMVDLARPESAPVDFDHLANAFSRPWRCDRFFVPYDGNHFEVSALGLRNGKPELERLRLDDDAMKLAVRACFDLPPGGPGPVVVDYAGNVRFFGAKKLLPAVLPAGKGPYLPNLHARLTDDHRRLILRSDRQAAVVHFMDGFRVEHFPDFDPARLSRLTKAEAIPPPAKPLLKFAIKRIAFTRNGVLRLGNESRMRILGKTDLRFQAEHQVKPHPATKSFGAPFELGGEGRATKAVWSDGSEVVLDSRRLLHFRSSDPNMAQATLVPGGDKIAMWFEHLPETGDCYYFSGEPNFDPAAVASYLRSFASRLPVEETMRLEIDSSGMG